MTHLFDEIRPDIKVYYFIEDGNLCWSLDEYELTRSKRRGYPYRVVDYTIDSYYGEDYNQPSGDEI